nr:ribonuclease H-like domain-containing protein [Tanacetum cinerariifolium]
MSWTGLPEFKDDIVTDYSRPAPTVKSFSDDAQNRNHFVTEEASPSTISPKSFIKFVKANDSPTNSKTDKAETAKKPPFKQGSSQNNFDDKGYWDSGCSRHMTGNISYLFDFEPFDEGYVPFGQGGCKITGKGTIKTSKLEFENVYFVKDLKYNLFSVSQICDNKNNVLFTDSECIVLCQNFKLSDDNNMLLRTPRQHNMYSIDLNNIVPHRDLTCLVAKASADECMLWHRRLVTDDFSRFTWIFFLKTKDETSGILRKFITEIENLKDLKVKIIRCDNKGEFRNKEMNDFCSQKGIKREFSNARTPQQNGVAKRRNRTLIEATRTMLADAKLLVTFWAEAVTTACYVQNRVLVNKSQNKTPYELFNGRTPAIGFLKPFGCHVMILNTLDNLGKFEEKGDEGYFIGYSISSKAFRTLVDYPKRVRPVGTKWVLKNKKDERGIFIRNKARLVAQGHTQEEGIDYDEVFAPVARIKAIRLFLAYSSFMRFTVYQMDVKVPFFMYLKESPFDLVAYSDSDYGGATQDRKSTTGRILGTRLISWQCKKQTIVASSTTEAEYVAATKEPRVNQEKDANVNSTKNINIVSPNANASSTKANAVDENIVYGCVDDPNMPSLEEIIY